jgi:hypothetical protein
MIIFQFSKQFFLIIGTGKINFPIVHVTKLKSIITPYLNSVFLAARVLWCLYLNYQMVEPSFIQVSGANSWPLSILLSKNDVTRVRMKDWQWGWKWIWTVLCSMCLSISVQNLFLSAWTLQFAQVRRTYCSYSIARDVFTGGGGGGGGGVLFLW